MSTISAQFFLSVAQYVLISRWSYLSSRYHFIDLQKDNLPIVKGYVRPWNGNSKDPTVKPIWGQVWESLSVSSTNREQWRKVGWRLWHSRKGEVRVTKGFVDEGKVRGGTRERTPKASKAIRQLNYFSRRAIKRYPTFPHWITELDSRKSLPTHRSIWPYDASVLLYHSLPQRKKTSTWYDLSNDFWLTLRM